MHHFPVRMLLTTKSTEIHSIIKQILDFASCIDVFYFRRWKELKGDGILFPKSQAMLNAF